jgi:predicted ribosome quality control (RQC) complex YloA/Tae2 family protein
LAKGLNIKKEKVDEILKKAGLDIKVRAQDLGVEEWVRLYHSKSEPEKAYDQGRSQVVP